MLSNFERYFHNISVYELVSATGSWGTTEKTYPATATKIINGYIQPLSGSDDLKNMSLDKVSTHRLYVYMSVSLNATDKLVYNGNTYFITFLPDNGIANAGDHQEIGLVQQR